MERKYCRSDTRLILIILTANSANSSPKRRKQKRHVSTSNANLHARPIPKRRLSIIPQKTFPSRRSPVITSLGDRNFALSQISEKLMESDKRNQLKNRRYSNNSNRNLKIQQVG